jgi:hypothetical protein
MASPDDLDGCDGEGMAMGDQVLELRMALLDRDSTIQQLRAKVLSQQGFIAQLQQSLADLSLQECNKVVDERADVDADAVDAVVVAGQHGNVDILRMLLKPGTTPRPVTNAALVTACQFGQLEAAAVLLAHGADVHTAYDSALLWACRLGDANGLELVRLLLQHGASKMRLEFCSAVRCSAPGAEHGNVLHVRVNGSEFDCVQFAGSET